MCNTIVMIHGMWGGSWYWENFKEYFENIGYKCHTPTLRYHDVSPTDKPDPNLATTSLNDYIQDLEEYIKLLDERPIIIGHSMGGLLAQILGAKGLADCLVLLAPAFPSGINGLKLSVMKSFWEYYTRIGFWRRHHRLSFDSATYSMLNLLPEEEQKDIYEKFVYESGRATAEIGLWFFDKKGAARVNGSNVICSVLVISGSQDRITPASVVKKIAKKYKKVSTYKEFRNHAHWVVGEACWEEIAVFVANWLSAKA